MSGSAVNALRDAIDRNGFLVTLEFCCPPREESLGPLHALCEYAAADPRVHAVALTDRVTSERDHDPVDLGPEVMRRSGKVPLIHLSGKDCTPQITRDRLVRCRDAGLENVLIITGDMPRPESPGRVIEPANGFVDSVHGIHIASAIRPPLLVAAAVTTFKYTEPEVMNQYIKMHKKIAQGARLIFNQVGYDLRKTQELAWYVRHMTQRPASGGDGIAGLSLVLPAGFGIVAALYWMTPGFARFALAGNVPGVIFTEDLCRRIDEISREPDKGQARRIDILATHILLCKRFGYRGVHIGGIRKPELFRDVLDRADELEAAGLDAAALWARWCDHFRFHDGRLAELGRPDGFYLFEPQPGGLNAERPASLPASTYRSARFALLRAAHAVFFDRGLRPGGVGERLVRGMARLPLVNRAGYLIERAFKIPLVGCQGCGSCSLPDTQYVCIESACAKHLVNGPCGGQRDGKCEAYPDRPCAWVEIYERAKRLGNLAILTQQYVEPKDRSLKGTCSWINLCLGRDHHGAQHRADSVGARQ